MSYKEYTVKVYTKGTKYWYLNGNCHREDGPAVERADGTKYWYQNDKLHREDGPACEYPDGSKYWYLNGKEYTEEKFLKKTSSIKEYTEEKFLKKTSSIKELTVADIERLLGHPVKIVKDIA